MSTAPGTFRGGRQARAAARPGFTLIEVVMSMLLISIVLLGTQSAILIVSKASPTSKKGPSATIAADGALDAMADDVASATAFSTMNANDIQFTVPDRNGDATPDTVRYVWSGTAGDPLQRQFNGGTLVSVIPKINAFTLAYDKLAEAAPLTYTTSGTQTHFLFATGSNLADATVKSAAWYAQTINPSIPAGAQSWSITQVYFLAQRHSGNTGQTKVQVRLATATGLPTTRVLGECTLLESSLTSSYNLISCNYNVGGLVPGQMACIVFQWVSDTEACDIEYCSNVTTSTPMTKCTDSGLTWNTVSNGQFLLGVYGTVTSPTATTQYVLTGVRATLQVGTTGTSVGANMLTLNQPVVTGP